MSDMDLYVEFGRKVAAARKDLRLTQAELAARVSLTRASVANIETGRQRVMLQDVYAIVEALDGRSILDFVPERIQKMTPKDVIFSGAEVSETEERLMLKMIDMATAGARPRRSK